MEERPRTFIEEARREQIVRCAVDVIADHGLQNATLARIAERAGISKGVISYHFDGKDDLLHQIVQDYGLTEYKYIWERVEKASTESEALMNYIDANIDFFGDHPRHLRAVLEIVFGLKDTSGRLKYDISSSEFIEFELHPLQELLQRGQERGEFRDFDPRVMAMTIRGIVESVATQILAYPELDLENCKREMKETIARATRAD